MQNKTQKVIAWFLALLVIVFGIVTLKAGGTVLFGGPEARETAGDYVPFVLWFNFIAGFFYIIAGVRLGLGRPDTIWWAGGLALTTLLVYVAFAGHILLGGAYEMRTVAAMALRSGLWVGVTGVALWALE